jgi:hypothetical protein
MSAKGEIGMMPDAAIFADTQAEPESVYKWLEWLEKELPFPVYRVTHGSLTDQITTVQKSKTGMLLRNSIPVFVDSGNGKVGKVLRDCTSDFKIGPLLKKQKELAGVERGQKEITVTSWIGISKDEIQRMKESRVRWCQHRWPLIELGMDRRDCKKWMAENGYPEPPRSACSYCPFHSDREWRRLKLEEPEEFWEAVRVERAMQKLHCENAELPGALRGVPYLHRSLKPLDEIDFSSDVEKGQMTFWQEECDGVCGV